VNRYIDPRDLAWVIAVLALGLVLAVLLSRAGYPAPASEPIVPRVTLDSLLAEGGSEADDSSAAPEPSPAGHESARGSVATEATVEGDAGATAGGYAPSTTPHLLTVTPEASAPDLAALAACGHACWGERMTRAEVEALALAVTGDAAWSAWAAWCFASPGRESGGYPQAVGGPNRDGSFDVGLIQMNQVHGTWADMERVLRESAYALEVAYALYGQQGVQAWRGC